MRVAFHFDRDKKHELEIYRLLRQSVQACGDVPLDRFDKVVRDEDDVGVVFGVAGPTKSIMEEYSRTLRRVLYVDKGYFDRSSSFRISTGGLHPWRLVASATYPTDRLATFRVPERPWGARGSQVLVAGTSAKFCRFADLGEANSAHLHLIQEAREALGDPVWYRPKPSWRAAMPLPGSELCRRPLQDALEQARCVVTYASNVAVDALIAGVPAAVVADGVLKGFCPSDLEELDRWRPRPEERLRVMANLAWCQWRVHELPRRSTWWEIRRQLDDAYPT